MKLYLITNLAGKHVVQIPRVQKSKSRPSIPAKPDRKSRLPVWDLTDQTWRVIGKQYLRPLSEEEIAAFKGAQDEPQARPAGRRAKSRVPVDV